MKMNFYKQIVLLISVVSASISAQSMLGLEYPTGILTFPASGMSLSMGRTGVGVQNDFLGMTKNPANLGIVKRAVFSTVVSFDFFNITDNRQASSKFVVDPELLSFAFPLDKFGAIGLSIDQRSSTDRKSLFLDPVTSKELGSIEKGGIVSWQAGWGYSIKKYAQLGITYERIYFTDKTTEFNRTPTEDQLKTSKDSTAFSWSGNGIRAGLMIPIKKFTAGLSGEYVFMSKADQFKSISGGLTDSLLRDSTATFPRTKSNFKPAPSLSLGLSYEITPEWTAAADINYILWKEFYSDIPTVRPLDNALSASAGVQYIPAPNLLAPKYYEIIQYRAGARFTKMPVATASEFAVDLGAGLPLQENGSIIDVNFEYGRRWDTKFKNYAEQTFGITLGINGGRKWYQSAESSY